MKAGSAETIKVVIRFKGREQLTSDENAEWRFNEDATMVHAPNLDGRANEETLKFTFDRILVEAT